MADYKPSAPFNVPMYLLIPTLSTVKGVRVPTYPSPEQGELIYGSFKTFGGTESVKDGLYSVLDTANIETWYRPDIQADCRIVLAEDHRRVYEVIGFPENINMRGQYVKFKVQAIAGGA